MAGYLWSHEETKVLLGLWSDARVQEQLEGARRNKTVFLKIAKEMNDMGHQRTWQQCRVKLKNIISKYRKVKDSNRRSGRGQKCFEFYDEVDAALGTRPASGPAVLVSSCNDDVQEEKSSDEGSIGEDGNLYVRNVMV